MSDDSKKPEAVPTPAAASVDDVRERHKRSPRRADGWPNDASWQAHVDRGALLAAYDHECEAHKELIDKWQAAAARADQAEAEVVRLRAAHADTARIGAEAHARADQERARADAMVDRIRAIGVDDLRHDARVAAAARHANRAGSETTHDVDDAIVEAVRNRILAALTSTSPPPVTTADPTSGSSTRQVAPTTAAQVDSPPSALADQVPVKCDPTRLEALRAAIGRLRDTDSAPWSTRANSVIRAAEDLVDATPAAAPAAPVGNWTWCRRKLDGASLEFCRCAECEAEKTKKAAPAPAAGGDVSDEDVLAAAEAFVRHKPDDPVSRLTKFAFAPDVPPTPAAGPSEVPASVEHLVDIYGSAFMSAPSPDNPLDKHNVEAGIVAVVGAIRAALVSDGALAAGAKALHAQTRCDGDETWEQASESSRETFREDFRVSVAAAFDHAVGGVAVAPTKCHECERLSSMLADNERMLLDALEMPSHCNIDDGIVEARAVKAALAADAPPPDPRPVGECPVDAETLERWRDGGSKWSDERRMGEALAWCVDQIETGRKNT